MKKIKKKLSKIILIIFIFLILFFLFNKNVNAMDNDKYTEEEIEYAVGAIVNSSQSGSGRRTQHNDLVSLGKNVIKTVLDNGGRITDIVRTNGSELLFNPSGKTNFNNLVDVVGNTWRDFASNKLTLWENNRYVLEVNETFERTWIYNDDDTGVYGFQFYMPGQTTIGRDNIKKIPISDISSTFNTVRYNFQYTGRYNNGAIAYYRTWASTISTYGNYNGYTAPLHSIGGLVMGDDSVNRTSRNAYLKVKNVIFYNSAHEEDIELIPYDESNLPDKDTIMNNYYSSFEETFEFNSVTNNYEVVNNNNYYTYNMEEILNNNTIINQEFITNNYITINEIVDDEEIEIPINNESKDYTNILRRILEAIRELPGQIAELVSFDFTQENQAGTNLWDVLQSLIDGILNLGTTILESLINGLSGLLEMLLNLLIPTEEQTLEIKNEFEIIQNNFTHKFEQVNAIGDSMSDIYSNRKSVYDLTYKFGDEEIHIIPVSLQAEVSFFRNLFSASILVMTLIEIYKRIVGRDDLIK